MADDTLHSDPTTPPETDQLFGSDSDPDTYDSAGEVGADTSPDQLSLGFESPVSGEDSTETGIQDSPDVSAYEANPPVADPHEGQETPFDTDPKEKDRSRRLYKVLAGGLAVGLSAVLLIGGVLDRDDSDSGERGDLSGEVSDLPELVEPLEHELSAADIRSDNPLLGFVNQPGRLGPEARSNLAVLSEKYGYPVEVGPIDYGYPPISVVEAYITNFAAMKNQKNAAAVAKGLGAYFPHDRQPNRAKIQEWIDVFTHDQKFYRPDIDSIVIHSVEEEGDIEEETGKRTIVFSANFDSLWDDIPVTTDDTGSFEGTRSGGHSFRNATIVMDQRPVPDSWTGEYPDWIMLNFPLHTSSGYFDD